jgi:tripartite-type tricarboxylate transporter receptor subunit TctC
VQAGTDVAAKSTDFGVIPAAIAQTFVNNGKVKIIGLCSEKKLAKMPAVPLMSSVVPGLNVYAGWGILLPKNTPPEVTKWYVDNFAKAVRSEKSRQFFDENLMFMDERELTPQGYKESMLALRRVWLPIAKKMDFGN